MNRSNVLLRLVGGLLLSASACGAKPGDFTPKSAIARLNDEPTAVPAAEVIAAAARPIGVEVSTDKREYRAGETIRLTVKAAGPGHARIFYRDAAGAVTTLFPLPADQLAQAVRNGAKINDQVPGGRAVVISGADSITGISIVIDGPRFGREEIAVLLTDFPVKEDALFIAQIERSGSAVDAARLTASLAIRQDVAAKSARAQVNADGVPAVLTQVGLASIPITTRP
jgi:hypothetical protein